MPVGLHWANTLTCCFFMMGLITSASIKKEITCYVCTPPKTLDYTDVLEFDVTFPNYNIEKIPTCGSSTAINFTLKCPEGYKGCLTKSYGEHIMKSCNEYSITDCKIANDVKYCFCANNLCNDATILSPIPITSDDEDLDQPTEDGSGQFDDWIQLDKHKYTDKDINTRVILNDTIIKRNSISKASAAKLILPTSINILSLMFIFYKAM